MKKRYIHMRMWTDRHARTKVVDTDAWYLNLVNELVPLIANSNKYRGMAEEQKRVALACVMYLEDCVANVGNWREFIHWHKESYGRYLPFYSLSEDYQPDEINREDIAFLLWAIHLPSGDEYDWVENPMDKDLLEFAGVLYERLDALFESAPISEHLAPDWLMETKLMQKKCQPLPSALPGEKLPIDVERFLEASKGEPLMFFDSYDALKFFFVHSLKWEDKEEDLLPDLAMSDNFVVYGNPKGLLIAPEVAEYFADKNNPFYSAEKTQKEAYEMFCVKGVCPFDLLKYGWEYNLLSEAQFPFENGKALLHENLDFVLRWFFEDYYEGE